MKRYQVYLDPESVRVLDQIEKLTSISRSQMIRAALDVLSRNLSLVGGTGTSRSIQDNTLLKMAGCLDASRSKKKRKPTSRFVDHRSKSDFSRRDDREYLDD